MKSNPCPLCNQLRIALLAIVGVVMTLANLAGAQDARIAASSVSIKPSLGEKKIEVSLRLIDDPAITEVTAAAGDLATPTAVPTQWKSFAGTPDAKCAWLVVIDNSNPQRAGTVAACVSEARKFLAGLPSGDAVMVGTIARDLVVLAPFETPPVVRDSALGAVRAGGEGAQATLIYQNLRQALAEYLVQRKEVRKAVVLFTDGKDETVGGPPAVRAQVKELIAAAKEAKVAIHTLGFAEKATEATFFADLKDLSFETEGLHVAAEVAARQLPPATWPTIIGVMHGGGTATLDVSKMAAAAPVRLLIKTASGKKAELTIEEIAVDEALKPSPEPAALEPAKSPEPASKGGADPEIKPEPEATPAVPETPTPEPGVEPMGDSPKQLDWLPMAIVGGLLLLAIIVAVAIARKRAAEAARRADALRRAEEERRRREEQAEEARAAQVAAAPKPALAHLEMCDAEQSRYPIILTNIKIGRGQHNDLVLRNDSISGNHCVIQQNREGVWIITDQASGNGVIVNGERVQQTSLKHGDTIELGDLKMRFLLR